VSVHDCLLPYVLAVDWAPVTREVPGWEWPFIIFAFTFLLDRFRRLADRRASA
jgi:hypothetical protein